MKYQLGNIYNEDCMVGMKEFPDNYFELAIVDPPYGIDIKQRIYRDGKDWDKYIPSKDYFKEMFRVSKDQIIWGANNFLQYLYSIKGFITWDKKITDTHRHAMFELAWCSIDKMAKTFYSPPPGERGFYTLDCKRIHPTQKPIKLYEWLLMNYAKEGDKILDTHMGSGSSVIACENLKFEYIAFELDTDYFNAADKRIKQERSQLKMF